MGFLYTFILLGFLLILITAAHYMATVAVPEPPYFFRRQAEPERQSSVLFSLDPAYYPIPKRAHPNDAGLDLSVVSDEEIQPLDIVTIDTGIRVAIPEGYVGLLCLRSGFSSKYPDLRLVNNVGIIDSGYTGNIKAIFEHMGSSPLRIQRGTRFGQLVIVPCLLGDPQFVSRLEKTERGDGGFGSTGQ